MTARIDLVAVSVALPTVIGHHRGHPVHSGIAKHPVTDVATLELGELNLAGDQQADLRVHGGPDKAVYAYASEHLPLWADELGRAADGIGTAFFGENLTTAGVTEADVGIGDVWAWGDARLQVTQPRWPCYKLTLRSGVPDMARRVLRSGRTGWYFRVLTPGTVPVAGPVTVAARHRLGVSVLDAHRAALPGSSKADVARVLAVDALAGEWRRVLAASRPGR